MYQRDEGMIDENMTEGGRFRLRRTHLLTWLGVAIALFLAGVALGESDSVGASMPTSSSPIAVRL